MTDPTFSRGQRVRMTAKGLATFPRDRAHTGVVKAVFACQAGDVYLSVHRDGYRATRYERFYAGFWEPVPAGELAADDTAVALALAVLRGETDAAKVLADRVVELCGGTRS